MRRGAVNLPVLTPRRVAAASLGSLMVAVVAPRSCGWSGDSGRPPLVEVRMESDYGPAACRADADDLGAPAPAGTRGLKVIVPPDPEAHDAAVALAAAEPRAHVYFSQTTGRPMFVHGDGVALASGAPAQGEHDLDGPQAAVRALLKAHPNLFGLTDPRAELSAEDRFTGPDLSLPARFRTDPESGGFAVRWDQMHLGLPVENNHLIGFFAANGDLLALVARLDPTPEVTERFAPIAGAVQRLDPEVLVGARWRWVDGRPALAGEDVVGRDPDQPAGPIVRTVWERDVATGHRRELRQVVELRSTVALASPLQPISTAPALGAGEPWVALGTVVDAHAPDSDGQIRDVRSTRTGNALYLGWHSTAYLEPTQWVSIADARHRLIGLLGLFFVLGDPIGTRAEDWVDDPSYAAEHTSATELAVNLRATIEWYHGHHGLRSWDGAGSAVSGAVDGNPWLTEGGFYNAYAGPGFLVTGDGRDPVTGRTLAAARDVVAHEFTHAVLLVHTAWNYEGESGAVSEAVADILGNAIEGIESGYELAEGAGAPVRDLANPGLHGNPATYDRFRVVVGDQGGVHSNSAILGRAAVSIWEDHGRDPMPLSELLVGSIQSVPWDPDVRMEEFGSALLATCFLRKLESGQPGYSKALCESVKRGLCRTRLLVDGPG